jgi:hypothetical protein
MNGFRCSKIVAEVLSVRKEPANEENGACMACLSAQNFLFQGQKEDYVMLDHVHKKTMGLYCKCTCKISTLFVINVQHALQIIIDSSLYLSPREATNRRLEESIQQEASKCVLFKSTLYGKVVPEHGTNTYKRVEV